MIVRRRMAGESVEEVRVEVQCPADAAVVGHLVDLLRALDATSRPVVLYVDEQVGAPQPVTVDDFRRDIGAATTPPAPARRVAVVTGGDRVVLDMRGRDVADGLVALVQFGSRPHARMLVRASHQDGVVDFGVSAPVVESGWVWLMDATPDRPEPSSRRVWVEAGQNLSLAARLGLPRHFSALKGVTLSTTAATS